ncbi:MAG TPA: hypothetical protein PLI45_03060 [Candidatus Woesebacteria bacterium]|nr:hypothetical protein [Candidatus Woesebacteria bacterium]
MTVFNSFLSDHLFGTDPVDALLLIRDIHNPVDSFTDKQLTALGGEQYLRQLNEMLAKRHKNQSVFIVKKQEDQPQKTMFRDVIFSFRLNESTPLHTPILKGLIAAKKAGYSKIALPLCNLGTLTPNTVKKSIFPNIASAVWEIKAAFDEYRDRSDLIVHVLTGQDNLYYYVTSTLRQPPNLG